MERRSHKKRSKSLNWSYLYVPMIYLLAGLSWVLFSHKFLLSRVSNFVSVLCDLLMIALTSFTFYLLSRRQKLKMETTVRDAARLRTLFNAVPDFIVYKDRHGNIVERNAAAHRLFSTDYSGELFDGDRLLTVDEYVRHEQAIELSDGTIRSFDVIKVSVEKSVGVECGTLVIGRDVADRIDDHPIMTSTNAVLESILDDIPDAIAIVDKDNMLIRMNKVYQDIFGYSADEIVGKTIPTIPDDLKEQSNGLYQLVLNGGQLVGIETKRKRKDDTLIDVSLSLLPFRDTNGKIKGITAITRDISEQKRAERLLRDSEAKYRLIADNVSDMIRLVDRNGRTIYLSPSHEITLGHPLQQVMNDLAHSLVHPEDRVTVSNCMREMLCSKGLRTFDFRYQHANGHYLTVEARALTLLGTNGEIEGVIIVARDITDRKQTEEQFHQSDKLAALGQLAAGIAHEIRNPLTALRGFIQLLDATDGSEKHYCGIMLAELDQINFIISELLLLAKPQITRLYPQNLPQLLNTVISLLDTQAAANNIQILTWLPEDLPIIYCEENHMKQVFNNILKNAIEAMPDGGEIRIVADSPEQGKVRVQIRDVGSGIDPERIAKLGEPFYTTKEKGIGLGLMVSYKIIKNHGGTIRIDSELGKGTNVEVILPVMVQENK